MKKGNPPTNTEVASVASLPVSQPEPLQNQGSKERTNDVQLDEAALLSSAPVQVKEEPHGSSSVGAGAVQKLSETQPDLAIESIGTHKVVEQADPMVDAKQTPDGDVKPSGAVDRPQKTAGTIP